MYRDMTRTMETGEEAAEKAIFIADQMIFAGYVFVGGLALYGSLTIVKNWII